MATRKSTRADGAARRTAILDAAEQVFADRGALSASLDEVRTRAGASPSSMYHHFGGMEALTLALLERTFERLFAELATRVTSTKSARACIESLVRGHVAWVHANRRAARVMYQLMSLELSPRISAPLARRKAELLEPVVRHFAHFVALGQLPDLTPLQFDVLVLGTAHEACRRTLAGAPLEIDWLNATLPAMAWSAISGHLREQPLGARLDSLREARTKGDSEASSATAVVFSSKRRARSSSRVLTTTSPARKRGR